MLKQVFSARLSKDQFDRRSALSMIGMTALTIGLFSGSVQAATTIKWAHVYEVGSPYHQAALWAAEEMTTKTDGRVTIKVFPASSLGKEVELNEALNFGSVDMIYTGAIFAGSAYKPLALSGLPFVIRNYDHWKKYRDSELFDGIKKGYEKTTGHDITGFTYYGARHVTSNKPINSPEDMEGMKIRVPNAPMFLMFPKAVNANASPLAFSEVYLALQQGLVDAQENPLPTIKFKKFYEVQKYINLTGHMTNSLVTVVSGMTKNRLSKEDYALLDEVSVKAAARASDDINEAEENLAQWFRDQGLQVVEVDKKPFQDKVNSYLNSIDSGFSKENLSGISAL
ncbi:sialic acid TRAP transporter substrate-binding protein SiaP [Marinomonas algicola]|uniref:sialic acid TRAP transporter substrate-binding protein SiaP n=1 Tax=Marinomonas algicola TaxID=2773454 RepID=UPI0019D614FC|nr:sialic acid TRAP transporter substrate-binding protein SiaP [Marinomonas algicola]